MTGQKKILDSLAGYFSKLSARERYIVLIGGAAFLFFVIFFALFLSRRQPAGKKTKIDQLAEQRIQLSKTAQEYAGLRQVVDLVDSRVAKRPADFDLYRKVNELIEATTIRPFVVKMDPGSVEGKEYLDEEYVDLNLQRIDLRMLVNFLNQLEQLPGLARIGQLSIKTRLDNSKTLDVVVRISAYKEKQ